MALANDPKDYAAKIKRRSNALNHVESDHVPIMLMSVTWPFGYAGIQVKDYLNRRHELNEIGLAPLKDIYCDIYAGGMFSAPIEAYEFLEPEEPQYFISDDGSTMQHRELAYMKPEEYGQLTADPKKYLENVILPRRYPVLNKPYPENYNALKNAFPKTMMYVEALMDMARMQTDVYGVPGIFANGGYAPMDYMLDFLRGFRGISGDMRRRPQELKEALEAVTDYLIPLTFGPALKKGDTLLLPLHCPPFLSPKQYKEFYWPTFKRFVDVSMKKGISIMMGLEGDWTPHLETLLEFPKNMIYGTIETTDIFYAKKKVGDHIALIGGMPCRMLRHETAEKCVDYTKKLIDELAPGGGYIFCTDVMLMSKNDIDAEKFQLCAQTILDSK